MHESVDKPYAANQQPQKPRGQREARRIFRGEDLIDLGEHCCRTGYGNEYHEAIKKPLEELWVRKRFKAFVRAFPKVEMVLAAVLHEGHCSRARWLSLQNQMGVYCLSLTV